MKQLLAYFLIFTLVLNAAWAGESANANVGPVTTTTASLQKEARAEKRFWKRLDRRLKKQAKTVKKYIRKESSGELQFRLAKFLQRSKLQKKYNVDDVMPIAEGTVDERYAFYSTTEYQELFKQKILEKIKLAGSFFAYLGTTQASKKAFWCRVGRGAMKVGGLALLGVGLAGGIGVAIMLNAWLTVPVVYMNPISWTFVATFLAGMPAGILSTRGGFKKQCPGE